MKLLAETVVMATIAMMLAALVTAGLLDFLLWLWSAETITTFLRANPWWYWLPVAGFSLIAVVLGLHLFLQPLLFFQP